MVFPECPSEERWLDSVHHCEQELSVDVVIVDVVLIWQIELDLWMFKGLFKDHLDRKCLQPRKLDGVGLILLKSLLPLGQQLTHEGQ